MMIQTLFVTSHHAWVRKMGGVGMVRGDMGRGEKMGGVGMVRGDMGRGEKDGRGVEMKISHTNT